MCPPDAARLRRLAWSRDGASGEVHFNKRSGSNAQGNVGAHPFRSHRSTGCRYARVRTRTWACWSGTCSNRVAASVGAPSLQLLPGAGLFEVAVPVRTTGAGPARDVGKGDRMAPPMEPGRVSRRVVAEVS